jgi:hypothetical protein
MQGFRHPDNSKLPNAKARNIIISSEINNVLVASLRPHLHVLFPLRFDLLTFEFDAYSARTRVQGPFLGPKQGKSLGALSSLRRPEIVWPRLRCSKTRILVHSNKIKHRAFRPMERCRDLGSPSNYQCYRRSAAKHMSKGCD